MIIASPELESRPGREAETDLILGSYHVCPGWLSITGIGHEAQDIHTSSRDTKGSNVNYEP